MSFSQSSENLTPDQSEAEQEFAQALSEEPADWSAEESVQDPAQQRRKKRTTITQEIVCRFLAEFNKPERATINAIAATVGISESAAKNILRKIGNGDYDCGEKILYRPKKKGRKPVRNEANERRVVEVLTYATTMTMEKAKDVLALENINMSVATISRIAHDQGLSFQKTTSRAGVVFTPDMIRKRHDYAVIVDEIPDEQLWYINGSGFNLHIAPLRAWAPKGTPPTQKVVANREANLTLLMVIGPDGIKYFELLDGAFDSKAFLASMRALVRRFRVLRPGEVTLVMDNARIHKAMGVTHFFREKGVEFQYLPHTLPTSTRSRTSSGRSRRIIGAPGFQQLGMIWRNN